MTTYYVGTGGSDAANGLSWANRKLTLNGAEDVPVAAGDTVYVGPGTYRELLTVDVSGTAGNLVTYVGDYLGTNTDGVGGVVRVTGSDNDQTAARANCIAATSKNYRKFSGFVFDITSGNYVNPTGNPTGWVMDKCAWISNTGAVHGMVFTGTGTGNTVQNCLFFGRRGDPILFTHTATVDNTGNVVENCVFVGATGSGVDTVRVGGITVRNCVFVGVATAVRVTTALTVGQTVTVNNCIIHACPSVGLAATAVGEIVENYNSLTANPTDRTNTNTGANSNTYPPLFDPRWIFQLFFGGANPAARQVISPFDLASYSQLVNLAGTSPTTTDLRGTAVQGAQREWGALEYDSTLKIKDGGIRAIIGDGA